MKKTFLSILALGMALSACDNAASKIKKGGDNAAATSQQEVETTEAQVASQANEAVGALPAFNFEAETHDFGKIAEGTVAKHDFTFTNTGEAPLIITNAQGSCGCTVPQWPREPIAPGETGTIHVEFNSNGRVGNQTKTVTLSANTVPNKKVLRISAMVEKKSEE